MPERDAKGRFPRGNGAGAGQWGGPPKGAGGPGKREGAGRPAGVKNGEGKRSVADLMAELGAREIAAQRWLEILNDPAHPKHADMVAKAADRLDGAPTQRVQVSDADPDSMTDEELAAIAKRGSRAPAGAAEDQD